MRLIQSRNDFRKVPDTYGLVVFAPCDGAILSGDSYMLTSHRHWIYTDIVKPIKNKIPMGSVLRVPADERQSHNIYLVFVRKYFYETINREDLRLGLINLRNKLTESKVSILIPNNHWDVLPSVIHDVFENDDTDVFLCQ